MDTTKLAVELFDKLAGLYQEKYMDVSIYGKSLDLFCATLPPGAKVLELACGPGNVTAYLLKKRPDLQILGTDLAPNMLELARKNNPTAKFELMDCRNLSGLSETYDAMLCAFCLPYLSKEEVFKLIADAYTLLDTGASLYLSTMEDDYSKSGLKKGSTGDELFMYYHEAAYLAKMLEQNRYKLLETERIYSPAADGSTTTDLILIARK